MNKVVAIVGLPGAGKSEVADYLVSKGFKFIRLGQIVLDEVIKKGLLPGEANERPIREGFRKERGMAAMAILNFPEIDDFLKEGHVVADGLYSWEEYLAFKERYGDRFICLAVCSSPKVRHVRLVNRKWEPENDKDMRRREYSEQEAESRDRAQIENCNQGGPIAIADHFIVNHRTREDLLIEVDKVLESIIH